MSKSMRLFIFLCFLFAFLISAPVVVLYTAGYRFDIMSGRIVHTAVLNISSEPRDARVFIDEIETSEDTPAVVETILPGDHVVSLRKDGYLPWETQLSFESREALVLGPIVLFIDAQPTLQQTISATIMTTHAQTNRFAYATQESSWLEVWVMDVSTSQTKLLMRLPYSTTSSYALTFSTHGTYLGLTQTNGSQQEISVARVEDGEIIKLPEDPSSAQEELLTFFARPFTTIDNRLVTLSESGDRMALSYKTGETASIMTYLPLGDYKFVDAPQGLIALNDIRRNRLIILDPQNREQPILLNEEATLWKWNASQDRLLYSSGYDMKLYVRSAHESFTITRLSTPIDGLDWHPKGNCAVYQTDGNTLALNFEGATSLSQTILATNLSGFFWISPDGTLLSIIRKTETGFEWWTRDI